MGNHMVYHVRAQWSLDPENPLYCRGEVLEWRPPAQDGWNMRMNAAHAGFPLRSCAETTVEQMIEVAYQLPRAIPFV